MQIDLSEYPYRVWDAETESEEGDTSSLAPGEVAVLLNGVAVPHLLAADDEDCWVEVAIFDHLGLPIPDPNSLRGYVTAFLDGDVQIWVAPPLNSEGVILH